VSLPAQTRVPVTAPALDASRGAEEEIASSALAAAAFSLARRFANGATMWCMTPEWPAHGNHVAVEFVHPVIVGKRSLPTLNLGTTDPVSNLRLLSRRGDVVLAVGSSGDPSVRDLMRRAEAWGLTRLWLGAGPAPPQSAAEHTVWLHLTEPELASRSGDLVMLYHLLWELTHVVLEHPGLLEPGLPCTEEVCVTCSDSGAIGEIGTVHADGTASTVVSGVSETVDCSLVAPVRTGDLVLVHAGVALTIVDDEP
jgi:HupF/HypC family